MTNKTHTMKYLDLTVLTSQIESVYSKYDKEIPQIKVLKFKTHMAIVVGEWEFYLDLKGEYYIFSSVVDTHYNDDVELNKIKSFIICDILNNNSISG